MKTSRRVVIVLLLLAAGFGRASGQGPTASNTITFSETYVDKIPQDPGGNYCEPDCPYAVGGFKVKATISLAGMDITRINTNTQFSIYIDQTYYTISDLLSDDPKYRVGKTSATFVQTSAHPDSKCLYDRTVRLYRAKLSWNAQYLTVTIAGKNNSLWYDQEYFLADYYDGSPTGPISTVTSGEIIFGEVDVVFNTINATGHITTKWKHNAQCSAPISSISIEGAGTQ